MIDKFASKWREFAIHDNISDLDDNAKVSLFRVFLETAGASKPSGVQTTATHTPTRQPTKQIRKPNRPATLKQINFLKKLVNEDKLDDDIDYNDITVGEASGLISQGVQAKPATAPKPAPAPAPEPEPTGKFVGSYNHESGGSESSADFWE